MATRIGTGSSGTTSSSAHNTTGAHILIMGNKWESTGTINSTPATDTAGNTWTLFAQTAHATGGEPHLAFSYCLAPIANAANVVTPQFTGSATFPQTLVEAFSSAKGAFALDLDGTVQQLTSGGSGATYTPGAVTTTAAGVVFAMVAEFNAVSGITAAGTPTFTLGVNGTDAFEFFLLSALDQVVSPSASVTAGATRSLAGAVAFKEVSGAPPPPPSYALSSDLYF